VSKAAPRLRLTQDPASDELLSANPFALLVGMLLDQQFPMERAFAGPALLQQRLGELTPASVAARPAEVLEAACAGPPAVHRYPRSMAGRIAALAAYLVNEYGGHADAVWGTAETGDQLLHRVQALPGFGEQKARIFVALLGKQLQVQPPGWQEAAGGYGEAGVYRSVADVTDAASLAKVRQTKQEAKAARRT